MHHCRFSLEYLLEREPLTLDYLDPDPVIRELEPLPHEQLMPSLELL